MPALHFSGQATNPHFHIAGDEAVKLQQQELSAVVVSRLEFLLHS